jgi:hypothetical protein
MSRFSLCLLTVLGLSAAAAWGQDEREEAAPVFAEPKKDWKWDEDKRFDFLMERLASLEASLDAVNNAIAKASGKKGAKQGEARRAESGNTLMDRKGGGPMKWNEFYGTTAEKFFYHPVDPNTTYHTSTVLSQAGTRQDDRAGESVQGNSGVPVHQRPPQFDYIYRANRDARDKAEAEATAIQGQIERLLVRRNRLELEQAELWCRLAFRAVQRLNIPRRPELRFRLVAASDSAEDVSRVAALESLMTFLSRALSIVEKSEGDLADTLVSVKAFVTSAREECEDRLIIQPALAAELRDPTAPLGQFSTLMQLLDETSQNLSESFEVAAEGDVSNDTARKDQFRGLLQRSLVDYAQLLMALDESSRALQREWKISVDTKSFHDSLAGMNGLGPDIEFVEWQAGGATDTKLIHRSEGFCFLVGIGGNFEGGGEFAMLAIEADDHWHLHAQSSQASLTIRVGVFRTRGLRQ